MDHSSANPNPDSIQNNIASQNALNPTQNDPFAVKKPPNFDHAAASNDQAQKMKPKATANSKIQTFSDIQGAYDNEKDDKYVTGQNQMIVGQGKKNKPNNDANDDQEDGIHNSFINSIKKYFLTLVKF